MQPDRMTNGSSSWGIVATDKLQRWHIDGLARNDVAAVWVAKFFTEEECRAAVEAVQQVGLEQYSVAGEPVYKVGLSLNEMKKRPDGREQYFELAGPTNNQRAEMFLGARDPLEAVRSSLAEAWSAAVSIASEHDGRSYFAGIIRSINTALIHMDWAPFDAPGYRIADITAQLTWNVYLHTAESGGAVIVYDRPWDEGLEDYRIPNSYGYTRKAVKGHGFVGITPSNGDLILFNPKNAHEVAGSEGGTRISASSFVGLAPTGELLMWS